MEYYISSPLLTTAKTMLLEPWYTHIKKGQFDLNLGDINNHEGHNESKNAVTSSIHTLKSTIIAQLLYYDYMLASPRIVAAHLSYIYTEVKCAIAALILHTV